MSTLICSIDPGSPAMRAGIKPGEKLLTVNGNSIVDVLDYKFYCYDNMLHLSLEEPDGKIREVDIIKREGQELGLNFETYLMDKARSCANNCIFCFIDQNPPGMRESIYFKDDDARLSFLLGNYMTLTNLTDREIQRIIDLRISPINISIHTTNAELRCKMLGNKFAGKKGFNLMQRFAEAGIKMNAQIVACRDWNDGMELINTMHDLSTLYPNIEGVSVVPFGMTAYREGLTPIKPYDRETARALVEMVDDFGTKCQDYYGARIFYCSDEFYIKAGMPVPDEDYYEGYRHLENGVGMLRLLKEEFVSAMKVAEDDPEPVPVSIATGEAAAPFIQELIDLAKEKWHNVDVNVYAIKNDYFGHSINVAGLVTGGDIIAQLKDKPLGARLLIPENMLRSGEDVFLDDTHVSDVEEALGVPLAVTACDGGVLLDSILNVGE